MMLLKVNTQNQKGFTLLELLVSITLLGLIILITAGALRAGNRATESSQKKIEGLERFRTSLSIIESQVQSAFMINKTGDILDTDFFQFSGDKTKLQFRSVYSLWGGSMGPVFVNYEVRDEDMGNKTLYASEAPVQIPDAAREVRLIDNAKDIHFEYFTKGPTDEKGSWTEEWTDKENIPGRIRLTIEKDSRVISLIVPVMTSKNNQPGTSTGGTKK